MNNHHYFFDDFVFQQSQNKDTPALHLKLNELIAENEFTSNRLIESEALTEDELMVIKKYYKKLSHITKEEDSIFKSHSVDEAEMDSRKKINLLVNNKSHHLKLKNMRKFSFSLVTVMIILMTGLSSCAAIGGIFKAGMWTGVIGIALVVFLVIFLIGRSRR